MSHISVKGEVFSDTEIAEILALIAGGGGSGVWYQDELPTYSDGIHYTLLNVPNMAILTLNGQKLVQPTNYSLVGANITLTFTASPSDVLAATYVTGSSATWYTDESLTFSDGVHYTLAHTPSLVVFLFFNGQLLISGKQYTRAGTAITLTFTASASDTLTATYS